jgi:hypothetical protein
MVSALGIGNMFSGTIYDATMCLVGVSLTCVMIRIWLEPFDRRFITLHVRCDSTLVSRII